MGTKRPIKALTLSKRTKSGLRTKSFKNMESLYKYISKVRRRK